MSDNAAQVSAALNRFTDGVMVNALSDRDHSALAELVEDFFCAPAISDDEPGSGNYADYS